MAQINITFIQPTPVPVNGYRVRYKIKGADGADYTTYPVNFPATTAGSDLTVVIPDVATRTDYEGVVDSDCGGRYSVAQHFSTTSCFCAFGFTESPDHTYCYQEETIEAIPPAGGVSQTAVAHTDTTYSRYGTYIYQPGDFSLTGDGVSSQIPTSNTFWINAGGTTTDGPLNRTGLWGTTPQLGVGDGPAAGQEVGFSVCITLATTRQIYVGMGNDNYGIVRLDGVEVIRQSSASLGTHYASNDSNLTIPFSLFHIYPLTISSGEHILEIYGHNTESIATMGAEVYDATAAELIAATSYTDLGAKLLFSSKDMRGQPIHLGTLGAGYTCAEGYALKACGPGVPVCSRTIKKSCGQL